MTAPLPPPPLASPAAVRRLRLEVGRRVDGLVQGDHLGRPPGAGLALLSAVGAGAAALVWSPRSL